MKEKIKNLLKKIPFPKKNNNKRHSLYINILVPTIVFALIGIVVVAYSLQHGVKKVMCANVDLYSGLVYSILNIPNDIATPLFALARLSGWSAHRIEELTVGKKLIRPAYVSVSEHKEYVPIKDR